MPEDAASFLRVSRREFLGAVGAAVGVTALPFGTALAQAPAKYHRLNVSNPQAARDLNSYKKAINAMLRLPPSDPRNWYRQVLVHTLDCTHGNWWFLVWHRGYLGWFEQICRELSGDPQFALPYWDWTENPDPTKPFAPRVPAAMFEDVLTPTHPLFIDKFDDFRAQFQDVVAKADYWKVSDPFDRNTPYGQLLTRRLRFPEDLWFDIIKDPLGRWFFERAQARGLTEAKPQLNETTTKVVSAAKVLEALAPIDFVTFGGPKTLRHSGLTGYGVLEGQPHNLVHDNVGGFMQDFMSPVDPLFFLHHANLDRLWDVWTRKQQALGHPIVPDGYLLQTELPDDKKSAKEKNSDYYKWTKELFLFFVDAKGQAVSKTTAGAYAMIGDFNYDYQPGSGEEVVPKLPVGVASVAPARAQVQGVSARITQPTATATNAASGVVDLPGTLLHGADEATVSRFAKITLDLPPLAHAGAVLGTVVVDDSGSGPVSPANEITLSMFGQHHTVCAPVTFTVPLPALDTNTLHFRVFVPPAMTSTTRHAHVTAAEIELLSIVVEVH